MLSNSQQKHYHNVNLPIIVPYLNIVLEDLLISCSFFLLGISAASILQFISNFFAIFIQVISFFIGIICIFYARSERKKEVEQKGISRVGIIRRKLTYFLGSDKLSGR